MADPISVVMLGATGAVGGCTARQLLTLPRLRGLTLLGRRAVPELSSPIVKQHTVDVLNAATYEAVLSGHDAAICTLGVGQPSKMSKEEFLAIDRDAVLAFAAACRRSGVRHFELLGAVGANATSSFIYLRTKGELEEGLKQLRFERLSLFQPSMILTPTNRYGFSQAVILAAWPWLNPLLLGKLRKNRGIRVEALGAAMANNLLTAGSGTETLQWDQFNELARQQPK